jgi:membrane-bound ClpP family serine protease
VIEYFAIGLGVLCLIGIAVIWFGQTMLHDEVIELRKQMSSFDTAAAQHEFSLQRVIKRVNKIPVPERVGMIEEDFMPEGDATIRP